MSSSKVAKNFKSPCCRATVLYNDASFRYDMKCAKCGGHFESERAIYQIPHNHAYFEIGDYWQQQTRIMRKPSERGAK